MNTSPAIYQVKLYPELSAAALKTKQDKELAFWYAVRALNQAGCDWLDLKDTLDKLVEVFHYSLPTLYRILKSGRLWDICDFTAHDGKQWPVIRIYGELRVARHFGITHIRRPVKVSVEDFDGVQTRRAQLYASCFKPEGSSAKPISRDAIALVTGVSRRQQRRYDLVARVRRVANFGFQEDSQGRRVPMTQLVSGKSRQYEILRRLPNTYHCQASKETRGLVKRVNRVLRAEVFEDGEAKLPGRYFFTARSWIKTTEKTAESFLLVPQSKRLKKGRMEWSRA